MLTSLLANIKNYLIVLFATATLAFGYMSYNMYGSIQTLERDISVLEKSLKEEKEAREKIEESHKSSLERLEALDKEEERLDNGLQRDLMALCKPTNPTPQVKKNEHVKTLPSVPRDGRLDPDLTRLLDRAYCEGNRDSLYCSAKGNDPTANSR
jgi:hypothetical protein